MTTRNWYVIRTKSRAEYRAASELERDGVEVFLPRVKDPHPRTGHSDMPLFPGYLFLKCNSNDEDRPSFKRSHQVLGWVGFGGVVPPLPDDFVEQLKQQVDLINQEGGLHRRFSPGEIVSLVSSTMESLAEVVEDAKSPQGRVKVLLQFMGRLVSAQVPREDLRPLGDQPEEIQRAPRRTRGRGRWTRGFGPRAVVAG